MGTGKLNTTGLVLSGGGAMGFAHIGAIQSLEEHRITPDIVAGTSMGALIGVFYAAGYSAKEIHGIVKEEKLDKLLTIFTPAISLSKLGLSSHRNVYETLEKYIPHDSFDELKRKLTVCATDLTTRECRYFNSGSGLHDAVIASSSIPGVFEAVRIDDGVYIDGGVIDNMPAARIRKDCKYIIGIDVNPIPTKTPQPESTFDVLVQTIHTIIHTSSIEGRGFCDYLISPKVNDNYNAFSFRNFEEIYREGYETMNRFLGANFDVVRLLIENQE